jgi:hypothetical protein
LRSRGSINVDRKKNAARLTSAAPDGSPSAFTNTSAYTPSTRNRTIEPIPHPAMTFVFADSFTIANAMICTVNATAALVQIARGASGA